MATEIASIKVKKDLVKQANVSYAKVKNDILTQEGIIVEALEFFIQNYAKVAESHVKRKQSA